MASLTPTSAHESSLNVIKQQLHAVLTNDLPSMTSIGGNPSTSITNDTTSPYVLIGDTHVRDEQDRDSLAGTLHTPSPMDASLVDAKEWMYTDINTYLDIPSTYQFHPSDLPANTSQFYVDANSLVYGNDTTDDTYAYITAIQSQVTEKLLLLRSNMLTRKQHYLEKQAFLQTSSARNRDASQIIPENPYVPNQPHPNMLVKYPTVSPSTNLPPVPLLENAISYQQYLRA